MGEFDCAVLIEQYAGKPLSKRLYPEWRGGFYYAGRPKANATAPLALLYISRWSSAEKASEFAEIYARSLAQRYKKVEAVGDPSAEGVSAEKAGSENAAPDTSDTHSPGFKVHVLKDRNAL